MPINNHRLDRFISLKTGIPKSDVRLLLAQKRVMLNNKIADSIHDLVDQFSVVSLNGNILQNIKPIYLMMHKPIGIVSATKDKLHRTVIDVLRESNKLPITTEELTSLHIVGRLDKNSSGLLLLTNDSNWSKCLMSPEQKVEKVYEVGVENPISDECIEAFSAGMYFPFENITTKPANLERLSDNFARVTLTEGKYHQIKRMFGRFRNPIITLHRVKIGNIELGSNIRPGEAKILTDLASTLL
jgi:16S rRNA pseudouridine516 synthase